MNNLKQLIKEFREMRGAATQGEWVARHGNKSRSMIVSYTGDSDSSYYPCAEAFKTNKDKNPEFIIHAANKITKLLDAVETLVEGLEKVHIKSATIPDENTLDEICELVVDTLQLAEEKVKGE